MRMMQELLGLLLSTAAGTSLRHSFDPALKIGEVSESNYLQLVQYRGRELHLFTLDPMHVIHALPVDWLVVEEAPHKVI